MKRGDLGRCLRLFLGEYLPLQRKTLLEESGTDLVDGTPVFTNRARKPLTRFGVRYILAKYARVAAKRHETLARKNVHPHTIRHTTAMHLLQSGVDINTIRCWLGHASVVTTNRYAETDLEMKRRALDTLSPSEDSGQQVIQDAALLSWLENL